MVAPRLGAVVGGFDGAHGPTDQIVWVKGQLPIFCFVFERDDGKNGDGGDADSDGLSDGFDEFIDAHAMDAGH